MLWTLTTKTVSQTTRHALQGDNQYPMAVKIVIIWIREMQTYSYSSQPLLLLMNPSSGLLCPTTIIIVVIIRIVFLALPPTLTLPH